MVKISIISTYIWNGKHPHLCKAFRGPDAAVGMALPNFKFYYWAANIRNTLYRCHYHFLPNRPSWLDMEIHFYKQINLPAVLAARLQLISYTPAECPVVKHLLKI